MENIDFNSLLLGINSKVTILKDKKVTAINFDNAATTPPFRNTLKMIDTLSRYYGSIGRGAGQKAEISTRIYNESRDFLLDYFNVKDKDKYTVIYTNNTTDGINKLAGILINSKDDIVISTRMEHHSNDLPWRKACKVDYIEVDENGRLKIDEIEKKLIEHNGKVKYLTVTGASNVTGYINDIYKIAEIVHKYNCKIIVDGAQLVPHKEISISGKGKNQNIDFLVFSAHKLYAPFGSGAIIGLKEEFEKNKPFFEGGGTVNYVMDYGVEYLLPPEKNEAGTPNYFGALAMNLALEELKKIGLPKIENKECMLKNRMINGLKSIPRVKIYGDTNKYNDSLGIIVFNIGSLYHQIVAEDLAKKYGISVRQGWFCSHPYCRRIMHMSEKTASAFMHDPSIRMPGMIRISFGMYNNVNEVDYFLNAIEDIERFYR